MIMSIKKARDELMSAGITVIALLDGDLETLRSFVYGNESEVTNHYTIGLGIGYNLSL